MSKFIKYISLSLMVTMLVSCGDLFQKEANEPDTYSRFATCEFDFTALSKIMTKNVKGDILCLENNLNLFIDVVKSDRPGFLPYEALSIYIENNMQDIDNQTLVILSAIFELNSLLFGDDINYMAKKNVRKLSRILIEFNQVVVTSHLYEFFTERSEVDFFEHNKRKSIIHSSLSRVGELFSQAIVDNDKKIEISKFLDKFRDKENEKILGYIDALLFLKKAILGGSEDILTAKELKRLTSNVGDVGKIAFDFVNLPNTSTQANEEEEVLKILNEDLETAYKNYFFKDSADEVIVKYSQLVNLVKLFFPQYTEYLKYGKSFLKLKEIILETNSPNFTSSEVKFLLKDFLTKNISRGVFLYRSYTNNETILGQAKRILLSFLDLVTFSSKEATYASDFNHVIKNYRFFQGSSFSPSFSFGFNRNARGVFDIVLYEDLTLRLFQFYGSVDSSVQGGYSMSQEQVVRFMLDFEDVFEGEGYILPGRAKNTAETVTLMTSLFHFQSDGDSKIEIAEFVEFIITLTTSLNFATEMHDYLKSKCSVDSKGRVTPACYRDNFLDFLYQKDKTDKSFEDYVPKLEMYLFNLSEKERFEYFSATSQFSRQCPFFNDGTEVPMSYGELFVSWGGLLAIEQSMLRFDFDRSSELEPNEVDAAFTIYENAIKGMIPYEFLKGYAKEFFLYLIKYKKVPNVQKISSFRDFKNAAKDGAGFARFALQYRFPYIFGSAKLANADRMTFAAVLRIIAENSPASLENPYPCETLR